MMDSGKRDPNDDSAETIAAEVVRDMSETLPPKSIETIKAAADIAERAALDERIRQRAYEMWDADGRPAGDGGEYWVKAETEICAKHD